MTIYDLLIYKHTINKNSLSLFLDGEISNPNSVMYKYIQYVNDYDNSDFVLGKLKEVSSLKSLESILKVNMDDFVIDDYNEYLLFDTKVSTIPSWAIDPEYFPLFVDIDNFNNQSLLSKNYLSKLFATGYLLVTKC